MTPLDPDSTVAAKAIAIATAEIQRLVARDSRLEQQREAEEAKRKEQANIEAAKEAAKAQAAIGDYIRFRDADLARIVSIAPLKIEKWIPREGAWVKRKQTMRPNWCWEMATQDFVDAMMTPPQPPARVYTTRQLLSRGWTRTTIRLWLGEPDKVEAKHASNVGDYTEYSYLADRVEMAEAEPDWRKRQERLLARRKKKEEAVCQ